MYRQSDLGVEDVLTFGFERVVVATGSTWRVDGVGRSRHHPISIDKNAQVVSVDDILTGMNVNGHVVVYDDDLYYMANVIAEKLIADGCAVTFVTSAAEVAPYTYATLEQERVVTRLLHLGVEIICSNTVGSVGDGKVELVCNHTKATRFIDCDTLIPVTDRIPRDEINAGLENPEELKDHGIKSVESIGDCFAPSTIAAAVYSGHMYARQLDNSVDQRYGFARENYQAQVLGKVASD